VTALKWVLEIGWKLLTGCGWPSIVSKVGYFEYAKETMGPREDTLFLNTLRAVILIHVLCIFYYFVIWPTKAQLFHKLSHSFLFRHYRVILSELVINTWPSYTSCIWNTCVNLARYLLHAPWGSHDSVETYRNNIICKIILHLLVILQNNFKGCYLWRMTVSQGVNNALIVPQWYSEL
jgi:hypothetical protein